MEVGVPPAGVDYSSIIPLAVSARASTRKFRPQTTNTFQYSSGQRVIRVPLTSSGFMDPLHSFLKLKLRAIKTGGVAAERVRFDGSIASIINRVRIEGPDGAELERIENYNVLHAMLDTITVASDASDKLDTVTEGKDPTTDFPNQGAQVPTDTVDGSSATHVYTLKLATALMTSDRFLPVGFIRGAGLTLEILLEDPSTCFVDAGATAIDYVVSDVEYVAHVMDMSPEFEAMFGQMLMQRGPVFFHGVSYRNFVYSQTNQSQFTIPISERARSLKALLVSIRDSSTVTTIAESSVTRRCGHGITQYQFKIGSSVYPQQPVTFDTDTVAANGFRQSRAEGVAELMKVFNVLNDVRVTPALKMYTNPLGAYVNTYSDPEYILGIDLERFPHDSGSKESGLNTAAQALAIELDIRAQNSLSTLLKRDAANALVSLSSVRFDVYSMVDVIFRLDSSGTLSAGY